MGSISHYGGTEHTNKSFTWTQWSRQLKVTTRKHVLGEVKVADGILSTSPTKCLLVCTNMSNVGGVDSVIPFTRYQMTFCTLFVCVCLLCSPCSPQNCDLLQIIFYSQNLLIPLCIKHFLRAFLPSLPYSHSGLYVNDSNESTK